MNEVEIVITGKNTAGPAFKEAQRDADKLGRNLNSTERDAAKLGRELKTVDRDSHEAGRAMDSASRDANQLGRNLDETARDAGHLQRQILQTKAAMAAFAVTFNQTGSPAALAGFQQAKSQLSQLQQVAKALTTNVGGVGAAIRNVLSGSGNPLQKTGGILSAIFNPKTIQTGISGLGNLVTDAVQKWPLAAAIVGGIILGAPAIAGAVTAVIGTAAVGAGLLIAIRKPEVKAAFTELGHHMMTELGSDAQDFEEPLIRAAGRIGLAFGKLNLGTTFHDAAKFVEPLTNGLIGLIQGVMPGLNAMIHNGGPAIAELSRTLSVLGADLGGLFKDLSSSAEGGAAGLHDLTDVLSLLIKMTGMSIGGIAMLAGWLDKIDKQTGLFTGTLQAYNDLLGSGADKTDKMAGKTFDANTALDIYHGRVKLAADGTAEAVNKFDELAQRLNQVTVNADTLSGAMVDKVMGATLSMDHAVLSFAESLTALDDNFKRGHITLDITKAKGQQLREAVLASVQANLQEYDTLIKLGMGADQAAAAYDANTGALERQLQKLGMTKGQIDDLIGKYRGVPANVDTDIATKGLTKAIEDLTALIRLINNIPDHTVHIDTIFTSYNRPGTRAGSQGSAFAHGGIVGAGVGMAAAAGGGARGGLTLVGEQGPELVRLPFGSTVHSNPDSEQMATAMAGAPTRPASVTVNFTGQTDTVFATAFMKLVRTGQIQLSPN